MKPIYWCIQLITRGKVYIYHENMPVALIPGGSFPKDQHKFIWLIDVSGGSIGFPVSEISTIEWVDEQVTTTYAAFCLAVDGPEEDDKEPWEA